MIEHVGLALVGINCLLPRLNRKWSRWNGFIEGEEELKKSEYLIDMNMTFLLVGFSLKY
jgi:hypothetical protein